MRKKFSFGLVALLATALFATSAFAANRVEVKVTSEPIAQAATCEKAGSYTMEFDRGTVLAHGDQITLDLPLNVSLCNDIDIVVPYADANTGAAYGVPAATSAVMAGADTAYFKISGDAGTQRVTIDVFMADAAAPDVAVPGATLTVADADADGDATLDKFVLAFFNQGTDGITVWDDANDDGVVDAGEYVAADVEDNTRCINVSNYASETVKDSLDSKADKYTFIPSDPQVAHIVAATGYSLYQCEKTEIGRIELGSKTSTQAGDTETCDAFDFETAAGFCDGTDENKLIVKSTADMALTDYKVELEILTDGVYWSNQALAYQAYKTATAVCEDDAADTALLVASYEDAEGEAVAAGDVQAPLLNECDVDADGKAVKLVSNDFALAAAGTRYLWFDMPAFNYDLDEVSSGDEVIVRVTVTKVPCGNVITEELTVGTFGCIVESESYGLSFPYFTRISGDEYWDGIALVNKSANDGTANVTIYEQDGDIFTAEVAVEAHSMYVNLTSALNLVQVAGSGEAGDAPFYMEVETDFNADGFAMMANPDTGESMGYLPRLDEDKK